MSDSFFDKKSEIEDFKNLVQDLKEKSDENKEELESIHKDTKKKLHALDTSSQWMHFFAILLKIIFVVLIILIALYLGKIIFSFDS